jgi:hypothetical protein
VKQAKKGENANNTSYTSDQEGSEGENYDLSDGEDF